MFGKASGFGELELSTLDGTNGFKVQGEATQDLSGWSVAGAGDVNGDGFDDLIVGAYRADANGVDSGASYVIFGRKPDAAVNRTGTAAAQTLAGGDFADTLSGEGGDDTLIGHAGNDTIEGGTGNDTVEGGAGADSMDGGGGSDTADYGTAATRVTVNLANSSKNKGGAAGDILAFIEDVTGSNKGDKLTGNGGANVLDGGRGADTMNGGGGDDTIFVDSLLDLISGGNGEDEVVSEIDLNLEDDVENGTLEGNAELLGGNDLGNGLTGNGRDNIIGGGVGGDTISAGDGEDTIGGDVGRDVLEGGNSDDVFLYLGANDSRPGINNRDVITDFNRRDDIINLGSIDADPCQAGNQSFTFVGLDAFSETPGELRYRRIPGGSSVVEADYDGDGEADLAIEVTRIRTLSAEDFTL